MEKKTSVIITTHYIEEANEAHCVRMSLFKSEGIFISLKQRDSVVKTKNDILLELDRADAERSSSG